MSRLHRVSRYDVLPMLKLCCLLFKGLNINNHKQQVFGKGQFLVIHLYFLPIYYYFQNDYFFKHWYGKVMDVEGDKGKSGNGKRKYCLKLT